MPDYYKSYRSNGGVVKDKGIYNKIITDFNLEIQDLIIEDRLIYLIPHLNLEILLKKEKRKPKIVDGKLINNLPVDWDATMALWAREPEAKKQKLLIRHRNSHTSGFVFRIYCKKFRCQIGGKNLYKFRTVRDFGRKVSKAIFNPNKNIDAYLLW